MNSFLLLDDLFPFNSFAISCHSLHRPFAFLHPWGPATYSLSAFSYDIISRDLHTFTNQTLSSMQPELCSFLLKRLVSFDHQILVFFASNTGSGSRSFFDALELASSQREVKSANTLMTLCHHLKTYLACLHWCHSRIINMLKTFNSKRTWHG